jgi:hypothetical protein
MAAVSDRARARVYRNNFRNDFEDLMGPGVPAFLDSDRRRALA